MQLIPSYLNGRIINLADFRPEDYCLQNVAMSLSRINRFTGHTDAPYSVAQHAVVVSYLVPEWAALVALHHDDAEAYIGDCPGPIKGYLTFLLELERSIERAVWEAVLGYQPSIDAIEAVKNADKWALRLEQINRQLRSVFSPIEDGKFLAHDQADVTTALDILELTLTADQAEELWLQRHAELSQ